jgi:hypothetical protein
MRRRAMNMGSDVIEALGGLKEEPEAEQAG